MAERDTRNLLLLGAVAVGAFLVGRALFTAQPVQAAVQAATPQAPTEPGAVIRGRNYAMFIPFPDIGQLFTSVRPTETQDVLYQPGQRIQFLPEGVPQEFVV